MANSLRSVSTRVRVLTTSTWYLGLREAFDIAVSFASKYGKYLRHIPQNIVHVSPARGDDEPRFGHACPAVAGARAQESGRRSPVSAEWHPSIDEIADEQAGLLSDDDGRTITVHLAACSACRQTAAALAEVSDLLAEEGAQLSMDDWSASMQRCGRDPVTGAEASVAAS